MPDPSADIPETSAITADPEQKDHEERDPRIEVKYATIERRALRDTVFEVDDTAYRSDMPIPAHWSIGWADLMMTMFILFLAMYVGKSAHENYLVHTTPEIVGGTTTDALDTDRLSGASFPFTPIKAGLPLITGGSIKKVERVNVQEVDLALPAQPPIAQSALPFEVQNSPGNGRKAEKRNVAAPTSTAADRKSTKETSDTVAEIAPSEKQHDIYRLSKEALASNNLEKFASIDLVPDNTMRIILTGDLLFATGLTELSGEAVQSLRKLTSIMKNTPYMINVVGHTDDVPIHAGRFSSNWELSVARASAVARFLINDMGMDPGQFVVSGYSSYRPLLPNTSTDNRAKNRRVEIIISKHLPNPVPATPNNLQ
jgi:chemotaxis protein MotB